MLTLQTCLYLSWARRVCMIQPACSLFTGMSCFIRGVRRGQWVLGGRVWGRMEEGIAGHHSDLRCLSDSENISLNIYIYITVYSFPPPLHTHTAMACISISATFPCIVSPHTALGWLEEGQAKESPCSQILSS